MKYEVLMNMLKHYWKYLNIKLYFQLSQLATLLKKGHRLMNQNYYLTGSIWKDSNRKQLFQFDLKLLTKKNSPVSRGVYCK